MINPKRLVEFARKWQRAAANGSRRISASKLLARTKSNVGGRKSIADKGHFVVYTTDGGRFVVPLAHLSSPIFKEFLRMSEEEFGLPRGGPITFPCDSAFMEHVVSVVKGRAISKDEERSLLLSMAAGRCSRSSFAHGQSSQQMPIQCF
ncbi:hypothetical protein ACLOJK_002319 [Asimina triloba]